jgi:DNA transformation protein
VNPRPGIAGADRPVKSDSFRDFVLDQLAGLPGVACRAMFGGFGLYQRDRFFGILHKGRLYFKTTPTSRPAYRQLGMRLFKPNAAQTLTSYYEVPVDVIEDPERLSAWAEQAIRCRPEEKKVKRDARLARR